MNIAIYVYNEAEVLDFAGPFEVFSVAKRLGVLNLNVFLIAENSAPVKARGGLTIVPNYSIDDPYPEIDLLIVSGGTHECEVENINVLKWIVGVDRNAKHVASVCTGVFILASAGLFKDLTVTTHGDDIPALRAGFPALTVKDNRRWITSEKYTTSGGISAGIDMSLYLVSRFYGQSHAESVAKQMEYDWKDASGFHVY